MVSSGAEFLTETCWELGDERTQVNSGSKRECSELWVTEPSEAGAVHSMQPTVVLLTLMGTKRHIYNSKNRYMHRHR